MANSYIRFACIFAHKHISKHGHRASHVHTRIENFNGDSSPGRQTRSCKMKYTDKHTHKHTRMVYVRTYVCWVSSLFFRKLHWRSVNILRSRSNREPLQAADRSEKSSFVKNKQSATNTRVRYHPQCAAYSSYSICGEDLSCHSVVSRGLQYASY